MNRVTIVFAVVLATTGCSGLLKSKKGSELDGPVPVRVVNHSKDRIREVIITREQGGGAKRAFRNLVGPYEKVRWIEPGQQHEFKIKGGTYTVSLSALHEADADYRDSSGYQKEVDVTGPREIVYEDKRGVEPHDTGEWKQLVLTNSQTPDESKRSEVTFLSTCKRPVETMTRNYGTRPNGRGKVQPGEHREPVLAYGRVGMVRPADGSEVWLDLEPGPVTVEIASTCDALAIATAEPAAPPEDGDDAAGKAKPKAKAKAEGHRKPRNRDRSASERRSVSRRFRSSRRCALGHGPECAGPSTLTRASAPRQA